MVRTGNSGHLQENNSKKALIGYFICLFDIVYRNMIIFYYFLQTEIRKMEKFLVKLAKGNVFCHDFFKAIFLSSKSRRGQSI